jgi:arsenate reductase (glutaredoxin)
LSEIPNLSDFECVNIKENPLMLSQIDDLVVLAGSYEALFSRKAKLYRELGLHEQELTEADYRRYLGEHYSFLSRPVIIFRDKIYIGSGKNNLEAFRNALSND